VIGSGLKLTVVGLVLGLGTSMLLARFIRTLLFGVDPLDPLTFVAAPGVLALVTMLACVAPAVRAMRADPAATLRSE
jgi:ABC-type lipoprotein release transport system permease subunit